VFFVTIYVGAGTESRTPARERLQIYLSKPSCDRVHRRKTAILMASCWP